GVADARVDVAVLLQREEVGGVVGVGEDERGRLVDRDGARAVDRVGGPAGVEGARAEPELALGRHGCPSGESANGGADGEDGRAVTPTSAPPTARRPRGGSR